MSEYVEKCPCCNNHSLEVTQHDWGEERRCELCGFAVAPSLPTQAHVGNAVAFVSASVGPDLPGSNRSPGYHAGSILI